MTAPAANSLSPDLPGVFFSLDGVDGAGKSTQCQLLCDWLREQGRAVVTVMDPGGTEIGNRIRSMLLDRRQEMCMPCEALLFMASRAQLTAEIIRPALALGSVIVADRFMLANVVYQGHAGGINPRRLWDIGMFATSDLEPDLTVVLDMPVDCALARKQQPADRMESRDAAYHERVRRGFCAEAERRPDRIKVVNAFQPVAIVHQCIIGEVARVLEARSRS